MRHAKDGDLDRLDDLLGRLRALDPMIRERTRGNFQYRSRAFLHFHADGDDLYADVRVDELEFTRRRVTTADEQADLLLAIAEVIGG